MKLEPATLAHVLNTCAVNPALIAKHNRRAAATETTGRRGVLASIISDESLYLEVSAVPGHAKGSNRCRPKP